MPDIPSRLNASLEGRYRVERELGAGGMATVYLARDLRHDREVALKVLHPELSAVIGAERFLGEIRTTAALQHPHILPLFDSGEADGLLFFVMPHVAGESLRDRLDREKQLPVNEAVALVAKVADALEHAHGRGVVHRDIKPANILLGEGGEPVVADFGIALAVSQSGDRRVTETGLSLGTPDYMSPEQAAGDRELGPRSDLYALGCVLYELLTGQPPFTGPTAGAVISRIITTDPEPPSRHRRSIPPHVEAVVLRALEKLPADRFSTAGDMGRALADPTFRHAVGAASPGGPVAPGRSWKPLALAALAVAGVLLVRDLVGGRGAGGEVVGVNPVVRQSVLDFPDSAPLALVGAVPLGVGMKAFDLSADGGRMVYVAEDGGRVRLRLRDMSSGDVTTLDGTEGAYAPFFSPDGEWVGYFAGPSAFRVSVSGGAPLPIASVELAYGGAWLPDGRVVLATDEGKILQSVPVAGGRSDTLRTYPGSGPEQGRLVFPELLPDGRRLVLSSAAYTIVRFDPSTREGWILTRGGWIDLAVHEQGGVLSDDLIRGTNPRPVGRDHLVFTAPSGSLMAVHLPAGDGEVPGDPIPVLDEARIETVWGAGQWDVSQDGILYYVEGETALRSWLVWRDDTGRVDTLSAFGRADWGEMDLSPDGRRLVVYACTVRGDCGYQLLSLEEGLGRQIPDWAIWYDSERLAYVGGEGADAHSVVVRADNEGVRDSIPGYWILDVARDGSLIALDASDARMVLGRTDAFPTGLRATELTGIQGWGHALRPGGGWLAYTSSVLEDGEWQVYLARTEPPWDRFRASPQGGEEPVWHPDGRLVYREGNRWMTVTVPDGPGTPGAAQPLFEGAYVNVLGRSHDVDAAGRHLLVEAPGATRAHRMTVVSGWAQRLMSEVR
ncbi:MAG TPA: protein kinase [Longimicrobiales bacterium]|nr:protein kinase [Longimicrobiales bacterium]